MSKKYVFLREENSSEIKKYCGDFVVSHMNKLGKVLRIYERNNVKIEAEDSKQVCSYCGTVSNYFTQDYREIGNVTSKYFYCIACANMSNHEFFNDREEGIDNIIKDLSSDYEEYDSDDYEE